MSFGEADWCVDLDSPRRKVRRFGVQGKPGKAQSNHPGSFGEADGSVDRFPRRGPARGVRWFGVREKPGRLGGEFWLRRRVC